MGLDADLAPDDALDGVEHDLTHAAGRLLNGAVTGQRNFAVGAAHDPLVLALGVGLALGLDLLAVRLACATISRA